MMMLPASRIWPFFSVNQYKLVFLEDLGFALHSAVYLSYSFMPELSFLKSSSGSEEIYFRRMHVFKRNV